MQRHLLRLLLPFAVLACAAEAFAFLAPAATALRAAGSLQERSAAVGQGQQQRQRQRAPTRRMAAPSMMAAGGAKKKVLVLGGDGCV